VGEEKCCNLYRLILSTYDISCALKQERRPVKELLVGYLQFLSDCISQANRNVVCNDLSIDAFYHLHLLSPLRFHYDCLFEYSAPIHHYPETERCTVIYRRHTHTGQYQLLDYHRDSLSLQFKDLAFSIPDTQKWKRKHDDRIVPYLKTISPVGLRVYLSLEAERPLDGSVESLLGNVFKLVLTEAKHPKLSLQGWDTSGDYWRSTLCLVGDDFSKWNYVERKNEILWEDCRQEGSLYEYCLTSSFPVISHKRKV